MSRIKRHKVSKELKYSSKKKETNKAIIYTLVLGGLMVLSVFGVIFYGGGSSQQTEEYGDWEFDRVQHGWVAKVNKQEVLFDYLPSEVEDLEVSPDVVALLKNTRGVIFTINPASENIQAQEYVRFQLREVFGRVLDVASVNAIYNESEIYDQPLLSCLNATTFVPVVQFEDGDNSSIVREGDCIRVTGTESSTVALKDRLLYSLFEIIK